MQITTLSTWQTLRQDSNRTRMLVYVARLVWDLLHFNPAF